MRDISQLSPCGVIHYFFLGVDHEFEGKQGTFFSFNNLSVLIELKPKKTLNPSCYTVVDDC